MIKTIDNIIIADVKGLKELPTIELVKNLGELKIISFNKTYKHEEEKIYIDFKNNIINHSILVNNSYWDNTEYSLEEWDFFMV